MGITALFSMKDIEDYTRRFQEEQVEANALRYLRRLGEEAVENAREQAGYQDQTGNLKSSIGFVIASNGQIIEDYFTGKTAEGNSEGLHFAEEIARGCTEITLIVVAGMEYGKYVEDKGLNVLTSAELFVEGEWFAMKIR